MTFVAFHDLESQQKLAPYKESKAAESREGNLVAAEIDEMKKYEEYVFFHPHTNKSDKIAAVNLPVSPTRAGAMARAVITAKSIRWSEINNWAVLGTTRTNVHQFLVAMVQPNYWSNINLFIPVNHDEKSDEFFSLVQSDASDIKFHERMAAAVRIIWDLMNNPNSNLKPLDKIIAQIDVTKLHAEAIVTIARFTFTKSKQLKNWRKFVEESCLYLDKKDPDNARRLRKDLLR